MSEPWNRTLAWLFLLCGFVWAVALDPWSLSERDPQALVGSPRMASRHAQAVVLAMGFFQLAILAALEPARIPAGSRWRNLHLVGIGTLLYVCGYLLEALGVEGGWVIFIGAVTNLVALLFLARQAFLHEAPIETRAILCLFCFGMFIDALMGLFAADAPHFVPAYIGREDEVRQRMLRLARVAVTALSLTTLLATTLFRRATPALARWGRSLMLTGTLGMPVILSAACFFEVRLKYLLPVPALSMTAGVLLAYWLARRTASRIEQFGWLLIFLSMNFGLLIGLYAFDGPLAAPGFVGEYNDFVRRLTRLGHAYCIVFGLLALLAGRAALPALAVRLLVAGSAVTLAAIVVLAAVPDLSTLVLAPGPVLVAAGVALSNRGKGRL
jgi:hypothetical protein